MCNYSGDVEKSMLNLMRCILELLLQVKVDNVKFLTQRTCNIYMLHKQGVTFTFWSLHTIFVFSFLPTKSRNFFPLAISFPAHQRDALSSSITSSAAFKQHNPDKI